MKAILFCSLLVVVSVSCSGQSNTPVAGAGYYLQGSNIAVGSVVSEMSKDIWVISQDKKGNYWFGSNQNGVYRYNGKTITHFSEKDGLCNNRINEIKEDKTGNVYFSTSEGISKFNGNGFTTLPVAPGKASAHKWKLEPGDLWFKEEHGGLYRYDGKLLYSLEFPKHYLQDKYYKKFPNTPVNPYDLYYIYKDHKGYMWFGTGSLGIYRYNGKSLQWLYEEHLTQIDGGGSFGIRSIMEDRKGAFWFCNTKYRYHILPGALPGKGNSFINYTREKGIEDIKDPIAGDRFYYQTIVEDQNGELWMQTYRDGIWRYDGKKMTHYPVKEGVKNIEVISMCKDNRDGIWLATQDRGVYMFNGVSFEKFKL